MAKKTQKTIYLASLGCAKAQVDAEFALGQLVAQGYKLVDQPQGADLVVVNTCSFIQPAIEESIETIVELEDLKAQGQIKELIVAGCLVDRFQGELAKELPQVDRFIPSGGFLSWVDRQRPQKILASPGTALPTANQQRQRLSPTHYAYVKVAEGCDRHCAFCTIPSIRGKQISRQPNDILQELAILKQQGVQEALLISQDTIRFGRDLATKENLVNLLTMIENSNDVPPWIRVHYLYPEPSMIKLIPLLALGKKILPYVDMPIQHASDRILSLMNRAHRQADIRQIVEKLRQANPDIHLRTTVIVGHPGETQDDHTQLMDFLAEMAFDVVGVFTYWDEAGTAANQLPDKVDQEEAYTRAAEVEELVADISTRQAQKWQGRNLQVLVDGRDPITGKWTARHQGQSPDVDGVVILENFSGPAGQFVDVEITAVDGYDLLAKPTKFASVLKVL